MSNERDELAELPASQLAFMAALKTGDAAPGDGRAFRTGFDAALSWKLPPRPRTVTTAAELDALPVGSVVLTAETWAATKLSDGWHYGDERVWFTEDHFDATVLHEATR